MNTQRTLGGYAARFAASLAAAALFAVSPALAAGPAVITNGSPAVTSTTAVVSGSYNASGATGGVDARFDWGLTPSLGNSTTFVHYGAASGSFSATISGLSPNTTYYYRAFANNTTLGPGYGSVLPFTTTSGTASLPTVTTISETHGSTTATLRGAYNGNGSPVETQFVWGTSASNLSSASGYVSQSATSGSFSVSVSGLLPNTTYYYRAAARTSGGTAYAPQILPFTTSTSGSTGNGTCKVNSFVSSAASVAPGGSTMLSWSTTDCASVNISGIGPVTPASGGSVSTGALYGTTTYLITASTGSSTDSRTATVTVTGGSSSGSSCRIVDFSASPSSVSYGGMAMLSWTTENCTTATIGSLGSMPVSGSTNIGPLYGSAYYTLSASGAFGSDSRQLFLGVTGTDPYANCSVTYFTASPATIASGQSATLSWNTSGCTSVTISGGSLYNQPQPTSGSVSTGQVYGTTTYTIRANGGTSTSSTATVYVTGSPYAYSYSCQYGTSSYDSSCASQYSQSFITAGATNVGSTSARLGGIVTGTNAYGYFEYGTTPALGSATEFQNVTAGQAYYYPITNLRANTTYYYRAVGQVNGVIVRGDIMTFTTLAETTTYTYVGTASDTVPTTTYVYDSRSSRSAQQPAASSSPIVSVTVQNGGDKIALGEAIGTTITYRNGTDKKLSDVTLNIVLPQGFLIKQTTRGSVTTPTTVTVPIGTLVPGQTDTVFIEATVGPNTPVGATLLTTATLSYKLPSGLYDSTVGYTINHARIPSALAGFAFGSGFFPTTLFGWMITTIIILILVLLTRRIVKAKQADHGHGGHGAAGHGH